MRVLITGGFGYLGSRIAEHLSKKGYLVTLGSSQLRSAPRWLPQARVVQIFWNDIKNLNTICSGIDVVIHTAGMNAEECKLDPIMALEFNGVSTARLARASRMSGVSKFIYLSTAHVYKSPLIGEISENSRLLNMHPYATSHVAAENAALYYDSSCDNFKVIALRLSNGVGAPLCKDINCWMLVVNNFCRQVVESGTIVVNSPRWVQRDFVPISLVCNATDAIISSGKINNNIINVSSSKAISLQDIVNIIVGCSINILGFKPEDVFKNKDANSQKNELTISNNKLRLILKINSKL